MIYTEVAKASTEDEAEKAVIEEIEKIKKDGITAQELQKVKNQKLITLYKQLETISGKANALGTYEVYFGDYNKLFNAPEAFNQVTIADIKRVANKYLIKTNATVGVAKSNVE
jgi:zinc protease